MMTTTANTTSVLLPLLIAHAISLRSHGCGAMQEKPRSICAPSTMTLLLKNSLN
jgi:hypothetical protein